ncbi:hypothetical protein [Streptococcus pluranimalium]
MTNNNSFNGGYNIGSGNSAGGNQTINITHPQDKQPVAGYNVEPIWRSPITMAVLTWISFIPTVGGLVSGFKVFEPLISIFSQSDNSVSISDNSIYVILFGICLIVLILVLGLRGITKNQTRYPLVFNYAISGVGSKLTLEKIRANCPICNGKMKFFNKPIASRDILYSDGKIKTEVTKRTPALQCKRNSEHWFEVDPAEHKI